MERLGILGGTFDPPHIGHLTLASESQRQLNLTTVLWVLTPDPPHKELPDITPYALRREMVLAAIDGNPTFNLCEVESERRGPHYMVDTIPILQKRIPYADFFLLIGEDSLRDLPAWRRPEELIALCPLAVLRRTNRNTDMDALEIELPGIGARTTFLHSPPVDISSTEVRELIRRGKNVEGILPPAVEKIIRRESLYQIT
jgi:nicotinate-nucleotide adenylyltransferase